MEGVDPATKAEASTSPKIVVILASDQLGDGTMTNLLLDMWI